MKQDDVHGSLPLPEAERIAYLIAGFLSKTLTEKEHDELDEWVVASDQNTRLFEELTDEDNLEAGIRWHQNLEKKKALENIKQRAGIRKKSFLLSFWPYAVAAALLLAVAGIYFLQPKTTGTPDTPLIAKKETDIGPGTSKAVLILENGRTVILDSAGSGKVVNEGGLTVTKGSGELVYLGNPAKPVSHTLSVPRGGQYKLTLADGTQVWLNAESSLVFPASFAAEKREVLLRGEGYFEVAKIKNAPFTVTVSSPGGDTGRVEVLGTHFNINGYGDDGAVKTTLVEGAVKVSGKGGSAVLRPGEQAQLAAAVNVVKADIEKETGWKSGLFVFRDASAKSIGAQLARWYDVDVDYKDGPTALLTATIDRREPLQNVLKVLADTRRVHFQLEGKKLIIKP